MPINRSNIRDFLLPGLAGIQGRYDQIPARFRDFLSVGSSRMATERFVEAKYTGLAQLKSEGAATVFDNSPGERFVYNLEHRSIGLGFAMTRESMDDNLYKESFNPQSMGLLESFAQTKDIFAAALLNTATTWNPMIGGDGVALCASNHPIDNGTYSNTPTVPLDLNEAALETTLNAIRTFVDQGGLLINARGRKMIVPLNLQWAAERLTKTELRTGTANNDISAIVSTGALPEGYSVNEFLTSPFAWFILSNIQGLVYYDRVPFEMDLQVDPTTGNLMVIGYERYGIGYRNPRGIYGQFPTA